MWQARLELKTNRLQFLSRSFSMGLMAAEVTPPQYVFDQPE